MNKLYVALLIVFCCSGLFAQWSTDAGSPTLIDNTMAAQVMPKTAITPTGETYVAWIDNSTGGYKVYLKRLSTSGTPVWANALLVSDHPQMTWLTEWDVCPDNDGNAVLVFQDIRNVTNNVYAYKISPTGTFLWGADGLALSSDTDTNYSNMAPTLTCTTTNNIIVAWQRMAATTTVQYQAINPAGQILWTPGGIPLTIPNARSTWPQLIPSLDGDILLKYYSDTGPSYAPTRHILVRRINPQGQDAWTFHDVTVQNLGAISAWTQWLSIDSDGAGGMVIAWHEDRDANNVSDAYVQHVTATGTMAFPTDGVHVTTDMTFHQFYPKTAFDPATQETYIYWNRETSNQDQWALQMQKLNAAGERQWTDAGQAFVHIDSYPTFPISAKKLQDGIVFLYAISPSSGNDQLANLKAYCVNPAGEAVWAAGQGNIATNSTNKLHFDSAWSGNAFGVVTWEDATAGSSHTYAMKFNADGSLGNYFPAPYNLAVDIVDSLVTFTWDMPETFAPPVSYKLFVNGNLAETFTNQGTSHTVVWPMPGTFTVYLTAVWTDGESSPSNPCTFTITSTYLPPTNLWWEPGIDEWTATFHWTMPDNPIPAIGYRFYNNDTSALLFTVNDGLVTTVTVPWTSTAVHMHMTAFYPGDNESIPSNIIVVDVANDDNLAADLTLSAYPNPFRSKVNLAFSGTKATRPASITIYDLKGRQIRRLAISDIATSATSDNNALLTWDGKDSHQHEVGPGIYFVRYGTGRHPQTLKLLKY